MLRWNWQVGVGGVGGATWEMGDFNGDGAVDGSDVTILAGNWQAGVTAAASAVPEPSTLAMLLAGALGLAITRCKKRRISMKRIFCLFAVMAISGICLSANASTLPVTDDLQIWIDPAEANSISICDYGTIHSINDLSSNGYYIERGQYDPDSFSLDNGQTVGGIPFTGSVNRPLYFTGSNADHVSTESLTIFVVGDIDPILGGYLLTKRGSTESGYRLTTYSSGTMMRYQAGGVLVTRDVEYVAHVDDLSDPEDLYLGSNRGISSATTGDLGEFLIFNRNLSAAEIDSVNAYLMEKWVTGPSDPSSVTAVPEPLSIALLLAGIFGTLLLRSRRHFLFVAAIGVLALTLVNTATATEPKADSGEFTVALIPDTQYYCDLTSGGTPEMYYKLTQWLKDQAKTQNIRFAIHLGDIVQTADVYEEWVIADRAQKTIEWSVPNSVLPGNHDLGEKGYYNHFFGPQRFEGQPFYGGHQGTTNNNAYYFFRGGGMDFMVLCLEHDPSNKTLRWANRVVESHPQHRIIVATHSYLSLEGRKPEGERIWQKFVRENNNIFMVVSGHVSGWNHQVSKNNAGNPVIEILSDYQWEPNGLTQPPLGGDGWLNTMKFVPQKNKIHFKSYSPYLNEWRKTPLHEYTLDYDMSNAKTKIVEIQKTAALSLHSKAALANNSLIFCGCNIMVGENNRHLRPKTRRFSLPVMTN